MSRRVIIEDESGQSVYELVDEVTTIGRGEDCELVVDEPRASRRHLKLTLIDDELLAEDLGSSNGTLVDGEPLVGKTLLSAGQVVHIGDLALYVDRAPRPAGSDTGPPASRRAAGDRRKKNNAVPLVIGLFVLIALAVAVFRRDSSEGAAGPDGAAPETASAPAPAPDANAAGRKAPRPAVDLAERGRIERRTRSLTNLTLEVEQFLVQDDFVHALDAISSFESEHGSAGVSLKAKVIGAMEDGRDAVIREYERLVQSGQSELARAHIRESLSMFPAGGAVRRDLEEVLSRPVAMSPGGTREKSGGPRVLSSTSKPAPPDPHMPRKEAEAAFFAAAPEAERLMSARRYAEAAEVLGRQAGFGRRGRVARELVRVSERRQRLAVRLAAMRQALENAIRIDPSRLHGIPCLPGKRGQVLGLGDEGIRFEIEGSEVELSWKVIRAEAIEAMIKRTELSPEESVGAAAFLFTLGVTDDANRLLRGALRKDDPDVRDAAFEVIADARKMDLPKGGFVWHENQFITSRDLERVNVRKLIESKTAALLDKDPAVRKATYEELFGLGSRAASAFHRGLVAAKTQVMKGLEGKPGYAKLRSLAKLRQQLDEARQHALELIFDHEKYPYPYRGRGRDIITMYWETQREIEIRTKKVRGLWDHKLSVKISGELREGVRRIQEYNAQLNELDLEYDLGMGAEDPTFLLNLPAENDIVTIRTFAWDDEERIAIDTSARWMRENDTKATAATAAERKQVAVTNDYRIMMGRHAVRLHEKLLKTARMHSNDMSTDGFFAHTNPNDPKKRTPRDRAVLNGYFGIGISENIAGSSGGPLGAHNSWIHSSGHHRNILGKSWRLLGSGNVGSYWTQNFSIREYTEEERSQNGREIDGEDGTPEGEGPRGGDDGVREGEDG